MTNDLTNAVHDDQVPRIDNAIAVGEDLDFQERWWKFEDVIWTFFLLILLADILGVFGHGWLAHRDLKQPGSGMQVKYEAVERNGTSSIMEFRFGPDAVQNGSVQMFVSQSLVDKLGTKRVIPQPTESVIGDGGITYRFPVKGSPAVVQFELEPSSPGIHQWTAQVPGKTAVGSRIVVVP